MSIVVDHDRRRRQILKRSIALFGEHGYDGVSYRRIAERCGLARTTIYKYFKSKREIFDASILQVTQDMSRRYAQIVARQSVTAAARLRELMIVVLDSTLEQRILLHVILDYLLSRRRAGEDVSRRLRRHTVGIKRMLNRALLQGIQSGEFPGAELGTSMHLLYGILEAAVLRLTVEGKVNRDALIGMVDQAVRGFCQQPAVNESVG
jgi:AcrR family transcriptional regulator